MRLRKLLVGKDRPSGEAVRSCMEQGAQFNWMTQQGRQSSNDTAISMSLARGLHEALDVILDYTGKVAPPKNGSFFEMALGSVKIPTSAGDFKKCVASLCAHGYAFGDEESSSFVLARAFDLDMSKHAKILLDAGAIGPCESPRIAALTLQAAMGMEGGVKMLLDAASPHQKEVFGACWWGSIVNVEMQDDKDDIITQGLALSPPSIQAQDHIVCRRPALLLDMINLGCKIHSHGPMEDSNETFLHQEKGSSHDSNEPFWRRNKHAMFDLMKGECDRSGFALGHPSPTDGSHWLSHMVLHENLVLGESWAKVASDARVRQILPALVAAGENMDAVDHRGYTAGWYILLDLIENPSSHSPSKIQGWLDVVRDFELYAAPVVVGGESVPFLEAHEGQMAAFLGRHGLLEHAQAAALERTTRVANARHSARRI